MIVSLMGIKVKFVFFENFSDVYGELVILFRVKVGIMNIFWVFNVIIYYVV